MPFSRPTLARLISRAQSDIEALLENGGSRVRRSVEYVMSRVMAGLAHGLHGHLDFIADQVVPDLADEDQVVRHASMWGLERTPATAATFPILVTGVAGSAIPIGSEWASPDGVTYENTEAFAIPAVAPLEVSVTVTATATTSDPENGTGTDGNQEGGATISLTSPVVGIDADATVEGTAGELQGGAADLESVDALRQRLRDRVQTPPSGGGPGDYVDWAKTVSGVTRAWEIPLWSGAGTVLVLFVQDIIDEDGTFVSTVFPDAAAVAEVQTVIDGLAPVTAVPTVAAGVEQALDPTIQLSPNDATTQAQVEAQLNDLLLRRAVPGGTLLISEINEAISLAANEDDHVLVSPAANVTAGSTSVITLGTVTFADIP